MLSRWGHLNPLKLRAELRRLRKIGVVEEISDEGAIIFRLTEKGKKNQADSFRYLLKKMDFYQLQKSLWLTPYPCINEIEFLKSFYHLGERVTVLTVSGLEAESSYKEYFSVQ